MVNKQEECWLSLEFEREFISNVVIWTYGLDANIWKFYVVLIGLLEAFISPGLWCFSQAFPWFWERDRTRVLKDKWLSFDLRPALLYIVFYSQCVSCQFSILILLSVGLEHNFNFMEPKWQWIKVLYCLLSLMEMFSFIPDYAFGYGRTIAILLVEIMCILLYFWVDFLAGFLFSLFYFLFPMDELQFFTNVFCGSCLY